MNYKLTNPQNSIWLTEKFYSGTAINNISGYTYIAENINLNNLSKAINKVIKKNDAMRIRVEETEEGPIQHIENFKELKFEIIEIDSKEDLHSMALEFAKEPFEIDEKQLFRIILFRLPDLTGGFFLSVHHLIADSWSLGNIVKEIIKEYSCIIKGEKEQNQESYSYINYIKSEEEYLKSEKFYIDKEYWKNEFITIPESATIPSINEKKLNTCKGNRVNYKISSEKLIQINNYCKENKISMYNFFMATYALYIGRVSNQEDFVIGTPILNRTNFEQKKTSGMFISTAPLRINIEYEKSFKEFVTNIAIKTLSLFRHQKYPYQYILNDIREKDSSIPNLYNIVLSYQITKTFDDETGVKYSSEWVSNSYCADDIQIHIFDLNEENKLTIAYDYKTDKYNETDISKTHKRILTIIDQILENNNIGLKDIEIVTPEEKHKILYEFNNTKVDYPRDKTIVDLFEEQVEKTPDNIAIVFEEQKLTYRELNEKSNQLARYLIENGVKEKSVVGLRLHKSLEMIIGIIAIIKIRATYLPINMTYPEERVNFMLEDSNATILLSTKKSNSEMSINIKEILIDLENANIYKGNTKNLNNIILPEDLIYIIYTSGSTGKPKGVMLCHKNVVRLMKNDNFLFNFNEYDIWTMFHSVAFDFSVWEMYGALLYGGKLIIVPDDIAKNPCLFLELLKKEKVTILNQTPSYFYNLQDAENSKLEADLKIRYVIFGGEALNPSLIKKWKNKYPFTKLINMYGITETTVHVTFKEIGEKEMRYSFSNIGVPIPTLKVYILNKYLKLQPYNAIGQLCVAGEGVCLGYLNRPELNKEKFIENPYKKEELIYLSGDNAYLSPSGDLNYVGRIDNQFKLRGFRIELDEIETKILGYPNVQKCIVLPKKIDEKDTQLVAFIVSSKNLQTSQIKNFLYDKLPSYMIPNHFVIVRDIPLTINGKADKKQLLSIPISLEQDIIFTAPRNKFESDFISTVESSLGISGIGIDHNIIDIGTDSLTLMKISIELMKRSYLVNIQDIYEYKTIRNISDNLIKLKIEDKNPEVKQLIFDFDETFKMAKESNKTILLTGATGFLGAHILYDLIKNYNYTVYCLVRKKGNISNKDRLLSKLSYYFGEELNKYIDKRIIIINGDITLENLGLSKDNYTILKNNISLVIHSAALVSHYGDSKIFKKMNVIGTQNIIDFCIENSIKLNYISTISIAGDSIKKESRMFYFNEHCLEIGQNNKNNIYSKTKFEAEKNIIKAIKEKKLEATIFRLGNITARYSDLKFQENSSDNAFLNRMRALINIGIFPESYANRIIDFSPVDFCSRIINEISFKSNCNNKIFHILNNNYIKINEMIVLLNKNNFNIKVVTDKEFLKHISNNSTNDNLGIINDITSNQLNAKNNISINSDFTLKFLKELRLYWPKIDILYILKFLKGDSNNEIK